MSVPQGWTRMATYDDRPDKKNGNPGDNYRRLLYASKKKQISVQTIPGIRGMLVLKDEAEAYLEKCRQKPVEATKHPEVAGVRLAVGLLARVADALEKIAAALEAGR
jgi:hypothetical protein